MNTWLAALLRRERAPIVLETIDDEVMELPVVLRHQRHVVTGTGINCDFVVRDARTLPPSTIIEVFNGSAEFIGLRLSGQTAYTCRVPPRGFAKMVCTANTTQAGTWTGGLVDDGLLSGNHIIDGSFASYATTGQVNDGGYHYAGLAGSISRSSHTSDAAAAALMGFLDSWWYGCCGPTTNNASARVAWGGAGAVSGFTLQNGPYAYSARFSLDVLPIAADDFMVHMGFFDTNDAVRMVLDRTMANPGNYYLDCAVGGVHTLTDTSIAAAARAQTSMRIEKARGGDRSDLWINNAHVASSAGGPAGAAYMCAGTEIQGVNTAGVCTRGMSMGYHRFYQAPAVPIL